MKRFFFTVLFGAVLFFSSGCSSTPELLNDACYYATQACHYATEACSLLNDTTLVRVYSVTQNDVVAKLDSAQIAIENAKLQLKSR